MGCPSLRVEISTDSMGGHRGNEAGIDRAFVHFGRIGVRRFKEGAACPLVLGLARCRCRRKATSPTESGEMKKRFEETQRFRTRAGDGGECYVVELTTFGHLDGDPVSRWVPVNRMFRTAEGKPVQLRGDGAFVVVGTGARLTRF